MKFDPIRWCWEDDEIIISHELKEDLEEKGILLDTLTKLKEGEIDAD